MSLIYAHKLNKFYPQVASNKQRVKGMFNILFSRSDVNGKQVLKDISFEVFKGESLAIIGKNGAGKSTLLKILAGVIQPTSGDFTINGRIGALLELGSGFDPEYTGLENLKMSAAMFGLTGKEAKEKISKMVEFADIGDYVNEPVKNYSSGMVVRLGFSVITQTKPELLITDEVLAVGDEGFQLKCLNWIADYLKQGGTLLLVSHSVYHVQKLCSKALWLEEGGVKQSGDVFSVTQAYQESIAGNNAFPSGDTVNRSTYHIHDVSITCQDVDVDEVPFGSDLKLTAKVYSPDGKMPGISIGIVTHAGIPIYGTYSELHQANPYLDDGGYVTYDLTMPKLKLLPGLYEFRFHTMTPENIQMIDTFEKELRVTGKTRELGCCQIETQWK
ncbi:Teichoic acid export ATP-binding protein TagH [hydrothermal vent metagenome]|uniref:Teichoic acid export ATP-binding protein TagH n=1 Tax=hydrothermal vent metagenome TaxID=652676 RepID=A0A3B0VHZ0_9ZZZZ